MLTFDQYSQISLATNCYTTSVDVLKRSNQRYYSITKKVYMLQVLFLYFMTYVRQNMDEISKISALVSVDQVLQNVNLSSLYDHQLLLGDYVPGMFAFVSLE